MRAEYDFANARPNPFAPTLLMARARRLPGESGGEGLPPLTRAQTRELDRRVRDLDNPVRYVVESRLLPGTRFRLFYSVSEYAWSTDVTFATLLKRRAAAMAVKALLSDRTRVVRLVAGMGARKVAKDRKDARKK